MPAGNGRSQNPSEHGKRSINPAPITDRVMYCSDERDEAKEHKGDPLKNTQRAGIEKFPVL